MQQSLNRQLFITEEEVSEQLHSWADAAAAAAAAADPLQQPRDAAV